MKSKIISSSIFSIVLILMAVYIGEFNSYLYALIGCAGMWGMTLASWANEKLKVENEVLKSANITLIQQQQKALDEISVLRQKYSRTNQPRSGGKFMKKSIPFKCPRGDYSCPYVDTMTSTLDGDCKSCKYKPL